MVSERKVKGDIATSKVIADLTEKGYIVFTPAVCEHAPFDMIAFKNGELFRIQAKFSSTGKIQNKQVWNDKHGTHIRIYSLTDFDYYAIYLPNINTIIYPNISFGGETIKTIKTNCTNSYYWYEDFLNFTDAALKIKNNKSIIDTNISKSLPIPTKEVIQNIVNANFSISSCSKIANVSRRTFKKYTEYYNIECPIKLKPDHETKDTLISHKIEPKEKALTIKQLQECVDDNLSIKDINIKFNISEGIIRRLLSEYGLKLNHIK
jgi:hypothetical protein